MNEEPEYLSHNIDGAESLGSAICDVTQKVMRATAEHSHNDGPAILKVAMAACIATLNCGAMSLGKKIDGDAATKLAAAITPESIMFTALMAAAQIQDGPPHSVDDDHMCLVATFGPSLFGTALDLWQKIYPDKAIEDYVEPGVAAIARENIGKATLPETINHKGFMLRNNGTIN